MHASIMAPRPAVFDPKKVVEHALASLRCEDAGSSSSSGARAAPVRTGKRMRQRQYSPSNNCHLIQCSPPADIQVLFEAVDGGHERHLIRSSATSVWALALLADWPSVSLSSSRACMLVREGLVNSRVTPGNTYHNVKIIVGGNSPIIFHKSYLCPHTHDESCFACFFD